MVNYDSAGRFLVTNAAFLSGGINTAKGEYINVMIINTTGTHYVHFQGLV